MGRLWRKSVRNIAVFALAFTISVSPAAAAWGAQSGTGQQETWYPEKEHAGLDYGQMVYERYDIRDMEELLEQLRQATESGGQEETVRALYHRLMAEEERMSTMYSLADIEYSKDMNSRAASDELDYMADLYTEVIDKLAMGLKEALGTEYASVLEEEMGRGYAGMLRYYEEMSAKELELHQREQELVQQYDEASAAEYRAGVEGEEWTYARLYEEVEPSSDQYVQVKAALDQQKNIKVGEIYRQLVKVRTEIAQQNGYGSYAGYSYELRYGRDFTPDDMDRVRADIKAVVPDLYLECWYAPVDYEPLLELEVESTEQILDRLEPQMNQIDEELGQAFSYMRQHSLYDIATTSEAENRSGSFTMDLPMYGDGFLFVTRDGSYYDYSSIIHEFGHFSSIYHDDTPSFFSNSYIDVSEVHSQGLQVLLLKNGEELFGEGAPAMENSVVGDMLDSVVMGAMIDEFETAVYDDPDMELEEINRLFKEISEQYDDWYYNYDGDQCYEWQDIPHIFHSPMYYVSYSTSAYSALCLWLESGDNWEQAADRYMSISSLGNEYPYREMMRKCGAGDIFTEDAIPRLDRDIRARLGLEPAGDDNTGGNNGIAGSVSETRLHRDMILVLAGISIVIVLQVLLLVTGFVIIWLVVKKRKND